MGDLGPWLLPDLGPQEKEEETRKLGYLIQEGLGELWGSRALQKNRGLRGHV